MHTNQNLIRKTAIVTAVIGFGGFLMMRVFGNQPIALTYVAAFNCVLLVCVAAIIARFPSLKHNGRIFIISIMCVVMSLIAFSGGINSRFVVILPLLPIMMCLMLNTTSSALLTAVLLTYIISVSALHPYLPEFIINISNPQEHFPRTLWLFLVTLLSFAFAKMYSDINSKLTIQLKDQRSHEDTYELYSQDAVLSYADNLLLKINSLKSTDNHLTLMLIDYCEMQSGEPLLPNSLNERRREDISNVIKKVFNHTTDIIGQCDDGKFIVCRHTQDLNAPLKSANSIEQHALKLSLDVNIGYISVAGNIGIDISSIFSLANKALEKSKTKNVPNIVNFRDIKSL